MEPVSQTAHVISEVVVLGAAFVYLNNKINSLEKLVEQQNAQIEQLRLKSPTQLFDPRLTNNHPHIDMRLTDTRNSEDREFSGEPRHIFELSNDTIAAERQLAHPSVLRAAGTATRREDCNNGVCSLKKVVISKLAEQTEYDVSTGEKSVPSLVKTFSKVHSPNPVIVSVSPHNSEVVLNKILQEIDNE